MTWLEERKVHRIIGTLLVFTGMFILIALLGWLIIPALVSQTALLAESIPDHLSQLAFNVSHLFRFPRSA